MPTVRFPPFPTDPSSESCLPALVWTMYRMWGPPDYTCKSFCSYITSPTHIYIIVWRNLYAQQMIFDAARSKQPTGPAHPKSRHSTNSLVYNPSCFHPRTSSRTSSVARRSSTKQLIRPRTYGRSDSLSFRWVLEWRIYTYFSQLTVDFVKHIYV